MNGISHLEINRLILALQFILYDYALLDFGFLQATSNLRRPTSSSFETVGTGLVVHEDFVHLFSGGFDKRTMLNNWLIQDLATYEDESGVALLVLWDLTSDGFTISVEESSIVLWQMCAVDLQATFQ
ncbi:hypothetical protein WICPIJ_007154 [Wickerhamomyces pijperi]|uniref:Uncharacterized protein n=1 Tax=Wickerhamomyces pijperi TaxID=599730 RepID=A0A9P8Q0P2_WICPI|nr:hypothetical protein WICPIJ_007154 [Wickerhamomyces pijperi]